MRRAIAEHMTAARQSIPHGQTVLAADLTSLVEWRDNSKAEFESVEHARLTLTVCFVAALAQALAKTQHQPVDLGVAVAIDNGLVVPVIRGADALGLGETARRLQQAADKARARQLTADDLQGGLMTVTNVGSFGNLLASPIVPLGQLGIFGPGVVERRPMPSPQGTLRAGWQCLLTLMFDRRQLDDFAADRLLGAVVDQLGRLSSER
jgi:2-oxoglutarate dehydrogenase E2 component (dihydrolipoamide succinyltransferase)